MRTALATTVFLAFLVSSQSYACKDKNCSHNKDANKAVSCEHHKDGDHKACSECKECQAKGHDHHEGNKSEAKTTK